AQRTELGQRARTRAQERGGPRVAGGGRLLGELRAPARRSEIAIDRRDRQMCLEALAVARAHLPGLRHIGSELVGAAHDGRVLPRFGETAAAAEVVRVRDSRERAVHRELLADAARETVRRDALDRRDERNPALAQRALELGRELWDARTV